MRKGSEQRNGALGKWHGRPACATLDASAPGITGDTVRLGLLMSDSGTAASQVIGARSGIDARIESENDRGGAYLQVNQAGTGFDVEQPRCGQPISGPAA